MHNDIGRRKVRTDPYRSMKDPRRPLAQLGCRGIQIDFDTETVLQEDVDGLREFVRAIEERVRAGMMLV